MCCMVQESNPGGGEIFHTHPDRPWGPPSLLYNGYCVFFPGLKQPGCGVDHQPLPSAEVKERVELYFYFPCGSSWPVLGWTLPLLYIVWCISKCYLAWILLLFVKYIHTWWVLTFLVSAQLGKGVELIFEMVGRAPKGVDYDVPINRIILTVMDSIWYLQLNVCCEPRGDLQLSVCCEPQGNLELSVCCKSWGDFLHNVHCEPQGNLELNVRCESWGDFLHNVHCEPWGSLQLNVCTSLVCALNHEGTCSLRCAVNHGGTCSLRCAVNCERTYT
jgi:hypothetical protein